MVGIDLPDLDGNESEIIECIEKIKKSGPVEDPEIHDWVKVLTTRIVDNEDSEIIKPLMELLLNAEFASILQTFINSNINLPDNELSKALVAASMISKLETSSKQTCIKEAYSSRSNLTALTLPLPSLSQWRRKLTKFFLIPDFYSADGQRLLSYLLACIDSQLTLVICEAIEKLSVGSKTSVDLSSIVHSAWKQCVDPAIKTALETTVEKWTALSLRTDKSTNSNYFVLLNKFHTEKDPQTAEFVCRSVPSLLYEYTHAANFRVRMNAVSLFCRTFPLVDSSLPAREYELEIEKCFETLLGYPFDPHPQVRVTAIKNIAVLARDYWEIIPAEVASRILVDLVEKLARDITSAPVRAAAVEALPVMMGHPVAQEVVKEVLPEMKNTLYDNHPLVRLAGCRLLLTAAHLPDFNLNSLCSLEEILSRLVYESVVVEVEKHCSDTSKSSSSQICEILASLVASSFLTQDLVKQVDGVIKIGNENPAALIPLLHYSSKRIKQLDLLRLSAALYSTAFHRRQNNVWCASLLMEASSCLLNNSQWDTKKKDKLDYCKIKDFIEQKFDHTKIKPFLKDGSFDLMTESENDAFGWSATRVLISLCKIPGYKPHESIIKAVNSGLRNCLSLGSPVWMEWVSLSDIADPIGLKSCLEETLVVLEQAHKNVCRSISGTHEEVLLDSSDFELTSTMFRILPEMLKLKSADELRPRILEFVESILANIEDISPALDLRGGNDDTADVILSKSISKYWCTCLTSATVICLLIYPPEEIIQLQDVGLKLANRLAVNIDDKAFRNLDTLVRDGSDALMRSPTHPHILDRISCLNTLFDCLAITSHFLTTASEESSQSLFGVRHLIVMWMHFISCVDPAELQPIYLQAWDCIAKLLRALLKSKRIPQVDILSTLALFCCFSFIDAQPIPLDWKLLPSGVMVVESHANDENKLRRTQTNDVPRNQIKQFPSVLSLPRTIASQVHPRLANLCTLIRGIMKESSGSLESTAILINQIITIFSNNDSTTLAGKWAHCLPDATRGLIQELLRAAIRLLPSDEQTVSPAPRASEAMIGHGRRFSAVVTGHSEAQESLVALEQRTGMTPLRGRTTL